MHRRMHPQTKFAWETGGHPIGQHPFFRKHGNALAGSAFDASKGHLTRAWKQPNQQDDQFSWGGGDLQGVTQELLTMIHNIMEMEAPHRRELEQAAIAISAEIWGIDPSRLRAHLTHDVQPNEQPQGGQAAEEPEEPEEGDFNFDDAENQQYDEIPEFEPEFEAEDTDSHRHIDHRVLMNLLTQGAAVHQYNTLHHMAAEKVNEIDPNLLKEYTRAATGITHTYWILPILQMMQNAAGAKESAVGSEQLEQDENGQGIVVAKGMCFPVLLHELTKGIMELLTYHQISTKDPVLQGKIVQGADKFDYEPWQVMIGPEVWRRFLKLLSDNRIPSNRIAYIIQQLSTAEPEEAVEFVDAVVSDPERASQMLARFNPSEEPEEPVYGETPESWDTDDEDPDAWKRGIQETIMAPEAPVAPTKPKTKPPMTPRPTRPATDPFNPQLPGKGKPGVMPQPKYRDEDFGSDDMIGDIASTVGQEWDLPPDLNTNWDPLQDVHPNGMNEGDAAEIGDVGFETCAGCGDEVPRDESICTTDGSFLCPVCADLN
jgi:hypothetical protein